MWKLRYLRSFAGSLVAALLVSVLMVTTARAETGAPSPNGVPTLAEVIDPETCEQGAGRVVCAIVVSATALGVTGQAIMWSPMLVGIMAERQCPEFVDRATEGDGFAAFPGQYQCLGLERPSSTT